MRLTLLVPLLLLAAAPDVRAADAQNLQNPSGFPIPRFVSLRTSEVNVRTGPGTRYPIQWVYRKEGLPVEIVEEFDQWRKIRDIEGTVGWVHKTMLGGTRTVLINSKAAVVLRSDPLEKAHPVLKAEPQVLGKIAECNEDWCKVQISSRKGWIQKKSLWGIYPEEKIN